MSTIQTLIDNVRTAISKSRIADAFKLLQKLPNNHPQRDEVALLSKQWEKAKRDSRLGIISYQQESLANNQVAARLLELLGEIENPAPTQSNNMNQPNKPSIQQTHHGSGDNVAGNKIDRQINIKSGNYIENQTVSSTPSTLPQQESITPKKVAPMPTENPQPLPETKAGLFAAIMNMIPKQLRGIVSLVLVVGAAYVGYHYYMPTSEKSKPVIETPQPIVPEKVSVIGRIFIDNAVPEPNEVTNLQIRNMPNVNSVRPGASGKFTFKNVKIPKDRRVLVDVTFANGQVIPTEEMTLGDVDTEYNTVSIPVLLATRPPKPKAGEPEKPYIIVVKSINNNIIDNKNINQQTTNGDNNATQN